MKISIGAKYFDGPWGGGNTFVNNIINYLKSEGHEVFNNINQKDLDIILLIDPRKKSEFSTISLKQALFYKKFINNKVKIIYRSNECDERKNTNYLNEYLLKVMTQSDHVIFVSSWLRNIFINLGLDKKNSSVILSGSDSTIFNNYNYSTWDKSQKLKIVTHHWGTHANKGYEVYNFIGNLLNKNDFKEKFEFTFIGNFNKKFTSKNIKFINPLFGLGLATELKKNNLYITASVNEPSGNHHIESSQCGLPIMYISSGGVEEYCSNYGLSYSLENLEDKLNFMYKNYDTYFEKMKYYKNDSNKMCKEYLRLFKFISLEQ